MKQILTAFLMVTFVSAISQTKVGVNAGANFSDLSGDNVSDGINNKIGFYCGGFVQIQVDKRFTIQPELLLSNQGYKYKELGGEFKTTFNYLVIPVLAQYHIKGFYAETGPQIGVLLSARRKGGVLGNQDTRDSFKPTAFSWIAGLGYQLESGFGIGLRYTLGLGSISDESSIDAKFNVLALGLSKSFNLKKRK